MAGVAVVYAATLACSQYAPDTVSAAQATLDGIERVVNELRVVDSQAIALAGEAIAATERENARVEQAVTAQLRANAVLGSRPITVVADELTSTVTLSGTVSTEEEKERAGQIAANAFPAGTVRNQLEVRQRL